VNNELERTWNVTVMAQFDMLHCSFFRAIEESSFQHKGVSDDVRAKNIRKIIQGFLVVTSNY
jgi:hypothetical protein